MPTRPRRAIFAKKKNLRLLLTGGLPDPAAPGTFLNPSRAASSRSRAMPGACRAEALKVVTQRAPTTQELRDLLFAFRVCKHVKSNAIVYAKGEATVGLGGGQPNRVDSARIAAWKSEEAAKAAGLPEPLARGSRRGVRRLLPLRRWPAGGGRGGCDGGDPAGRVDARRRGDRRGR